MKKFYKLKESEETFNIKITTEYGKEENVSIKASSRREALVLGLVKACDMTGENQTFETLSDLMTQDTIDIQYEIDDDEEDGDYSIEVHELKCEINKRENKASIIDGYEMVDIEIITKSPEHPRF